MPLTMIPKHTPALLPREFGAYYLSPLWRGGPATLQEAWKDTLPGRRVFGTPAGRHALWYFMDSVGLPPGSEVLVPAYNYYVVVRLIVQRGMKPVFVDVDPLTLTMDPGDLRRKVTPASRMVLVTHMFGAPADVTPIRGICDAHGLWLFEDCAHGVGTLGQDGQVGLTGDGALFSLGPAKIVTGFGGGLLALRPEAAPGYEPSMPRPDARSRVRVFARSVVTLGMSPAIYRWTLFPLTRLGRWLAMRGIPQLRDLVAPSKDLGSYRFREARHCPVLPFMARLSALQLARLRENVERRREVIRRVRQALADEPRLRFTEPDRFGRSNGSYFGVFVPDTELFARFMERRGVEVNPHEFYDCSELAQFRDFAANCPNARWVSAHLARLPSYPTMTERDIRRMVSALRAYAATLPGPLSLPAPAPAQSEAA
jgi:dTDP-4-amino-4,6-dideoxygalactose transaminase